MTFWLSRYAFSPLLRNFLRRRVQPLPNAWPDWIAPEYKAKMQLSRRSKRGFPLPSMSVDNRCYWESVLGNARAVSLDLNWRNAACEFRSPVFHLDLVEFMRTLPTEDRFSPAGDRLLQRDALQGILPDRTLRRRSKGGPEEAFFTGLKRNPEWTSHLTEKCCLAERGYIDLRKWRQALEQASVGHSRWPAHLWNTCILEAWFKNFHEQEIRSNKFSKSSAAWPRQQVSESAQEPISDNCSFQL